MRPYLLRICCFLLLSLTSCAPLGNAAAAADAWPEFRGPGGQGHAQATGLPLKWSEQENIAWKTPIPGRGWSSPVIAGERIWVTTGVETELAPEEIARLVRNAPGPTGGLTVTGPVSLRLLCLERRSGRILYDVELFHVDSPEPIHKANSYASPTPIVEGGRLYCHFGTYGTACVDAEDGRVLWTRRLPLVHMVGPGSSPILCDNLLIIPCDGSDVQYVTALDKRTGATVWKTGRPPIDAPDGDRRKSFCTPLLIDLAGRRQVIIPCAQWIVAYDPQTGHELWRMNHGGGFSIVPRPVYGKGMVYFCTGFARASLCAVRVDGHGDVTATHVAWKTDRQIPLRPSPLLAGDLLYVISDSGVATCFDAATGRAHWTRRIPGNYSASPLLCDARVYFFNEDGKTTVLQASPRYEPLAVNTLDTGCKASAAALGGALYVRTEQDLYCIADRSGPIRETATIPTLAAKKERHSGQAGVGAGD